MVSPTMETIRIQVRLVGFLVALAGVAETELVVAAGTRLPEVMSLLGDRLGSEFRDLVLTRTGEVYPGIVVAVEGRTVPANRISEQALTGDCRLRIAPIVAGG